MSTTIRRTQVVRTAEEATVTGPTTEPVTGPETEPVARPEPIPYVIAENGSPFHPLQGWQHLHDVLALLSTSEQLYFAIVERSDGCDRWAQAMGESGRLLVELGDSDGPRRVGRADGDDAADDLHTVVRTKVSARAGEYWDAEEATRIVRDWLASAGLTPSLGLVLRKPDDWS